MRWTQQSMDLFLFVCVFSTVGTQTVQDSLQQNISLVWIDGMYPEICWLPPPKMSGQSDVFNVCVSTKHGPRDEEMKITSEEYCTSNKIIMHGGLVQFYVNTSCEDLENKQPVMVYNNTDLVKSWECLIRSSSLVHCSWEPTADTPPELKFFYVVSPTNINYTATVTIKECPSYTNHSKMRTGCNVPMEINDSISFLLNGTVHKKTVRNTYQATALNVGLPPINWTVDEIKNASKLSFKVSWIPPDIFPLSVWSLIINYTKCDQPPIPVKLLKGQTSWILYRVPSCPYNISVRAEANNRGGTEWSQKTFKPFANPDENDILLLFSAILIPLVLAVTVTLTLTYCLKNKKHIFPTIPVPRDLLSDLYENNNKITIGNLYNPAKEEEDCNVTLVMNPQINKVDV